MTSINYSIAPSDMAFHALTTSLYKDRLRAPVREILSNAIDIQRRTGNTTPVEIKLPTALDTQFRIRDFGTGLSKDDMLRLYSSLFSSDKHLQKTNEVGGFGVGAKSPFAYTDAFTVESFHAGRRTIYSAFMDGNNAPQLLELFQEESDEPSGLAVSYPIEKKDERALLSIVAQEVFYCGHPVQCIGGGEMAEPLEKNSKFSKIENMWLGADQDMLPNKSYVRMGNVMYPAPKEKMPPEFTFLQQIVTAFRHNQDRGFDDLDNDTPPDESYKNWRTLVLDVPIGSVRPAMSREELVLGDALTQQGLTQSSGLALRGLYQYIIEKGDLNACMDLWRIHQYEVLETTKNSRGRHYSRRMRYLDFDESRGSKTAETKKALSLLLAPESAQLEAMLASKLARDALWKNSTLEMHPGLFHSLCGDRHMGRMFRPGQIRDGYGMHRELDMMMSGFRPASENEELLDIWSQKTPMLIVPYQPDVPLVSNSRNRSFTHASSAECFEMLSSELDYYPGHRRTEQKQNHKKGAPRLGLATVECIAEALSSSDMKLDSYPHRYFVPAMVFATSPQHEADLLAMAAQTNKKVYLLDLTQRKVHEYAPTPAATLASGTSSAPVNPYANVSSPTNEVKVSYRDSSTGAIVQKTLTELPVHWISSNESSTRYTGPLLEQAEHCFSPETPLYLVHNSRGGRTDGNAWCSDALITKCEQLLSQYTPPATKTDWLLANLDLPAEHPLYDHERQMFMRNVSMVHALEKERRSHRQSHDTPTHSLRVEDLDFVKNTDQDKAFAKRYPLIKTWLAHIGADNDQRPLTSKYKDALLSYVQAVDKKYPTFDSALLPTAGVYSAGPELG